MRQHMIAGCAISVLTIMNAAQAAEVGGLTTNIVLTPDNITTFTAPVRCKQLTVRGKVEIRSADERREDMSLDSSWNNKCGTMTLPNTVKVACDEIIFEQGAELQTWSHLLLYGGLIRGPANITGLRSRKGADGKVIDVSSDTLNGANGRDGKDGSDGDDAGSGCCPPWVRGADAGSNGGNGEHGENGKGETTADRPGRVHAKDGNHGLAGENNVCVTVHTENFDGSAPILVTVPGGTGGSGSDGQNGGHGGNGGKGGTGGQGGDSDDIGGRSEHGGTGGTGGNGGNGSDGGRGGNGGVGGDGGRIEIMIQEDQDGKGTRPATGSTLNNFGGDGGAPGVGGRGGKKGLKGLKGFGGKGGDGSVVLYRSGHAGGAGDDGQDGNDGQDGANGLWGEKGRKGETVENIFGYGRVNTPTEIDWNAVGQ